MKQQREQEQERVPDTRTTLTGWKCSACHGTCTDFVEPNDFKRRYCQRRTQQGHCGGNIVEVYRGSAA